MPTAYAVNIIRSPEYPDASKVRIMLGRSVRAARNRKRERCHAPIGAHGSHHVERRIVGGAASCLANDGKRRFRSSQEHLLEWRLRDTRPRADSHAWQVGSAMLAGARMPDADFDRR